MNFFVEFHKIWHYDMKIHLPQVQYVDRIGYHLSILKRHFLENPLLQCVHPYKLKGSFGIFVNSILEQ